MPKLKEGNIKRGGVAADPTGPKPQIKPPAQRPAKKKIECSYDPRKLKGVPMGMFHCPQCGEMIIAGCPHPDYALLGDFDKDE
jgi:hypothetical protein